MLMFLPGFAFILLFQYGPMYGIQIGFKDYRILDGIWRSPWVGFKYFHFFLTHKQTIQVLINTIVISLYRLLVGFPAAIILAVMVNEVGNSAYKKTVQTFSYLPHFISWVIVAGIFTQLLSPSTGAVNYVIKALGGKPIYFMIDKRWFRSILVFTGLWKEVGWSSIIYLAALSGVDPGLHEAAIIDGASRIQRIRNITIPSIMGVVVIVLILDMAYILNAGMDQIINMYNPNVYSVSDIIDTYVYRVGLTQFDYSTTTAVGVFKSLVGLILLLTVNAITGRTAQSDFGLF